MGQLRYRRGDPGVGLNACNVPSTRRPASSTVIGIDPGSAATGWAIIATRGNRYLAIDFGVIRPKGDTTPVRLADLSRRLEEIVDRHRPEQAAVETPFTGRNPRSAFVLAQARGVILAVLGARTIEVADYTPADVKKSIVGTGRAEKAQVVFMVTRLLGLGSRPAQDAADAMAVALTHIHNAPARRRLP